jgi:extradiol dioxygenase family protein
MTVAAPKFHLAFPVIDLEATRLFYTSVLGCAVGREDTRWIDFDFHGHQISAHLSEQMPVVACNSVDGKQVPVSHFGLVLGWKQWHALAESLGGRNVDFLIEPHIRFRGQVGEQATMFLRDPNGNGIELKAFRDPARLFAR